MNKNTPVIESFLDRTLSELIMKMMMDDELKEDEDDEPEPDDEEYLALKRELEQDLRS